MGFVLQIPLIASSASSASLSPSLSLSLSRAFSWLLIYLGSIFKTTHLSCLSVSLKFFVIFFLLAQQKDFGEEAMRAPTSFKQELLEKWMLGLRSCGSSAMRMSLLERKKAIKLSVDVAMASARNGKTCWSRAIIAKASKQEDSKTLVRNILGSQFERLTKASIETSMCNKRVRSKSILRRSCSSRRIRKIAPKRVQASSIAKRMLKKRTQVLKGLVPGGESMDEFSLLEETLDYILSLQAQVDVMRCLADAP